VIESLRRIVPPKRRKLVSFILAPLSSHEQHHASSGAYKPENRARRRQQRVTQGNCMIVVDDMSGTEYGFVRCLNANWGIVIDCYPGF
jgi:hypothetical protein